MDQTSKNNSTVQAFYLYKELNFALSLPVTSHLAAVVLYANLEPAQLKPIRPDFSVHTSPNLAVKCGLRVFQSLLYFETLELL